jgi:hypothetical protein
LSEVVNQVASLERILDGLLWFAADRPDAHVEHCHPSTSSAVGENDITVSHEGEVFRIEAFDTVGNQIVNDKLNDTLKIFGRDSGWVSGRLLMFVSSSISRTIGPRQPNARYHFAALFEGERTHVFEVVHP